MTPPPSPRSTSRAHASRAYVFRVPAMPRLVLLLLALAVAVPAAGQTAGSFARFGFSARGVALGGALAADPSGDASAYYNPALAPFAPNQRLEATAALLTLDRSFQTLQFATPLKPRAGIAVGLVHAGVAGIDGRDNSGYHTQEYATDEFAFFLAFGTRIGGRLTAGVGLQIFRADLIDELTPVNTIGVDAGLTFRVTDALHLGLVLDDLLARYTWDTSGLFGTNGRTTTDRFPTRLRLGGAYRLLDGRALVTAEYESRFTPGEGRVPFLLEAGGPPETGLETTDYTLHDARFRLGAEYRLADALSVRGGVDRLGAGATAQPSAGFAVTQPVGALTLRAEYAFALQPFDAGGLHMITMRVDL